MLSGSRPVPTLPEIIRELIMKGSYAVSPRQQNLQFQREFYDHYQDVLDDLHLGYLPLAYNGQEKQFQLFSGFVKHVPENLLSHYRRIFDQRYQDVWVQDDAVDEDENDTLFLTPIDYRISNEDYALSYLHDVFHLPGKAMPRDHYGWIENRRLWFYNAMDDLCELYALPRLPIHFKDNQSPCFQASQKEITQFIALLDNRKEYTKLEITLGKNVENQISAMERYLPVSERSEKATQLRRQHSDHLDQILQQFKQEWSRQNDHHPFPSQVNSYPAAILSRYREQDEFCGNSVSVKDRLSPYSGTIHPN